MNSLASKGESHTIMNKFVPSIFSNDAGVYCVFSTENKDCYIGSATNFRARWEQHYQDMFDNKPSPMHKALLSNNHNNYTFSTMKTTCNYITDFINKHHNYNLDAPSFRALQIMTQYECRLLVQSLITAINPNLNGSPDVIFSFKFDPENLIDNSKGSRAIIAK